MARPKKSSNRPCATCKVAKPSREYPTAKALTCTDCLNAPPVPDPVPEPEPEPEVLPEIAADIPAVEIDYSNPTTQELSSRTLARRRMLFFIKRFKPKYMAGWVHEDICRRLERFMARIEAGESPRLLLMMPYRHGKSELCSRHFVPWVLGHHPNWEVIAASNAQSLATSFSRYIRDLMRDPSYHALFPNAKLDPQSQSVENWNTTSGGGYMAAGVGTAIIGRGADMLLIDDPMRDAEAADSPVIRDNTWEWYISTAYSRLSPSGGVLGILTCWNEDDWAGRIEQAMGAGGDKFEIVRYPAINDKGDEYILPDDSIQQLPPGSPIPEGSKLTRLINTALHPARYTVERLLAIKANYYALGNQRWWAAGYQQNPTPEEGVFFTKSMFMYYEHEPKRVGANIYQAWDFAITEKEKNDWNVGVTLLQDEHDNLFVLDMRRFKTDDGDDLMREVVSYAEQWRPTLLGVEDGQIWKSLSSTFAKLVAENGAKSGYYPSFEPLVPLTDKRVRASPLRGRMQNRKVWFPRRAAWFDDLQREMLRFQAGGKHDDIVDAISWCVRLTLSKAAPKPPEPPRTKSWRDKLATHDSSGTSFMSA
jgi:predicted phage terminase large subunit-like protein